MSSYSNCHIDLSLLLVYVNRIARLAKAVSVHECLQKYEEGMKDDTYSCVGRREREDSLKSARVTNDTNKEVVAKYTLLSRHSDSRIYCHNDNWINSELLPTYLTVCHICRECRGVQNVERPCFIGPHFELYEAILVATTARPYISRL
jgi:hypothetical protein